MKFNWGHGITIAIVLIMITFTTAFIVSLSHDNELVTDGYYEKELTFQDDIRKKENALKYNRKIDYDLDNSELRITISGTGILSSGLITLYRADDKNSDVELKINEQTENRMFTIPFTRLKKGKYIIKADWEESGKQYLVHQTVFVP